MRSAAAGKGHGPLHLGAIGLGIVAFAVLTTLGVGMIGAQGPSGARLTISPQELLIGDVVTVTARVNHPSGHRVGPLELGETWGPFEVSAIQAPVTVSNNDGSETTSISFDAQIFEVGTVTTPDIRFTIESPTGGQGSVVAAPVTVEIQSVLTDDELRDIRSQATLPGPNGRLVAGIAAGALAAVAICLATYIWARRRSRSGLAGRTGLQASPYEWAVAELAAMGDSGFVSAAELREHYERVAEILRRYLDAEFYFETMERTTSEANRRIMRSDLEWKLGHRAISILAAADLVKFARHRPTTDEVEALVPDATAVIGDLHRSLVESRQVAGPESGAVP